MHLEIDWRLPLGLDDAVSGSGETEVMSLKATLLFVIGVLAVTGVVGLIAVASVQHSRSTSMSNLAQLVKQPEAYARARSVIVEQRAVLDRLAHALLQWETLQGPELERVFAGELATSSDSRTTLRPRSARQPSFSAAARPLPAAAMTIEPQEK
jgi:hypothetical protein